MKVKLLKAKNKKWVITQNQTRDEHEIVFGLVKHSNSKWIFVCGPYAIGISLKERNKKNDSRTAAANQRPLS